MNETYAYDQNKLLAKGNEQTTTMSHDQPSKARKEKQGQNTANYFQGLAAAFNITVTQQLIDQRYIHKHFDTHAGKKHL